MATKFSVAIMGVKVKDYNGIVNYGRSFLNGMYKLPLIYPDVPMDEDDFSALVVIAENDTADAESGNPIAITNRNKSTKKVYDTIKVKLLPYLNDKFPGDKAAFQKAGANVSADPTPVPPPEQPKISKIVRGPEAGSIKVNLVKGENSKLKERATTEYRIYLFAKPDDKDGKEIGSSTDSRYLYGYGVPYDEFVWISVRAKNSGGASLLASKVKFFLASE